MAIKVVKVGWFSNLRSYTFPCSCLFVVCFIRLSTLFRPTPQSPQRKAQTQWGTFWVQRRSIKGRHFNWISWHKAVALNLQRVRKITNIDDKCHMCILEILKIIAHRLWNCKIAGGMMTMALALWRAWKPNHLKRDLGVLLIGNMRSLRRRSRPHLANMLEFGFSLKISPYKPFDYTEVASSSTKLDGLWRKHQTIWHGLRECAHIICEKAFKDVKKSYLMKFLENSMTWLWGQQTPLS